MYVCTLCASYHEWITEFAVMNPANVDELMTVIESYSVSHPLIKAHTSLLEATSLKGVVAQTNRFVTLKFRD